MKPLGAKPGLSRASVFSAKEDVDGRDISREDALLPAMTKKDAGRFENYLLRLQVRR
jgi:hypothetical protein